MKSIRFSYVWWHYTDDADEINCFIFNNKTDKILDIKTQKVHEIDPNNIFKSIKQIYGNKGRIDDTISVLSYYIYNTGTRGYLQSQIYGEAYKYVNTNYLENFEKLLKNKIKKKQQELLDSIKNNDELEF